MVVTEKNIDVSLEAAEQALYAYEDVKGEEYDSLEESIIDLVTDLLHVANWNAFDPDMIIRVARTHWESERKQFA